MIEDDDKIVAEVVRHASTVASGIAHHLALSRNHPDIAALVESIYHHMGAVGLREGEAHQCRTLRRTNLCRDIIVGEIDTIIIRCSLLSLMREPTSTFLLVEDWLAHGRHQGELTVIINPRTRLVRLLQTSYLASRISIYPPISHLARLWHPEVHTPRHGNGRISIARRKTMVGVGTHEGIDKIDGIL